MFIKFNEINKDIDTILKEEPELAKKIVHNLFYRLKAKLEVYSLKRLPNPTVYFGGRNPFFMSHDVFDEKN